MGIIRLEEEQTLNLSATSHTYYMELLFLYLFPYFYDICQRQCHYEFNMAFCKSCIVFCAKPKEVDPTKLIFSMTNNCFDCTQIYNLHQLLRYEQNQGIVDWNAFFFLLKISITSISFYWRNDTPTFVTWSLNQFVPEIVSALPCSSGLVRHILL